MSSFQVSIKEAAKYNSEGASLANQQKYNKSISLFEKALKLSPGFMVAKINLGLTCILAGKQKKGTKILNELAKEFPKNHALLNQIGIFFMKANENKRAITFFKRAIKNSDKVSEYYFNLAESCFLLGQYEGFVNQAEINYKKAIKLNPNFTAAYLRLGNLFEEVGSYTDTIKQFEKVLKHDPKNHIIYGHIISCYNAVGRFGDAEKYSKRFDKINTLSELPLDNVIRLANPKKNLQIAKYWKIKHQ